MATLGRLVQHQGVALRERDDWTIELVGLKLLQWVEPDGKVHWVIPRAGSDAVRGADYSAAPAVTAARATRPVGVAVYELTEHGAALRPAVYELIRWGGHFMLPPRRGDRFDDRWLPLALGACARALGSPPHALQLIAASKSGQVGIHVSGGPDGTMLATRIGPAELTVQGEGRALLELATGMRPPAELAASRRLRFEGDQSLVNLVPEFFDVGASGGLLERKGEAT